jgi:hypothetical protein
MRVRYGAKNQHLIFVYKDDWHYAKKLMSYFFYVKTTVACKALHEKIMCYFFYVKTTVVDACAALREKLTEIKGLAPAAQYGLFLADEDPKKGKRS